MTGMGHDAVEAITEPDDPVAGPWRLFRH